MTRPGSGAVALTLWLVGAAGFAGAVLLGRLNGGIGATTNQGMAAFLALTVVFATVGVIGAVVAWRRPGNPVGWLFLAIFVVVAALVYGEEHAAYALADGARGVSGGVLAAWVASWAWFPAMGMFFLFVPLLFPTGRPPSARWGAVGWVGGAALAVMTVQCALAERLTGDAYSVPNPVGRPGVVAEQGLIYQIAAQVLAAAVVLSAVSLLVRFRRSRGEERQQLKWFALAAMVLPLVMIVEGLYLAGVDLPNVLGDVVFVMAISLLPLSAGLAILRYRLYDIDRLISRTVSYATLTALLAAVYAGMVVAGSNLAGPLGAGSDIAVAAATLTAAAVFAPARRRIQATVDRRFNRARYDAQLVVGRFRAHLRDEVGLDQLTAELTETVRGSVQPARASLWLRSHEVSP